MTVHLVHPPMAPDETGRLAVNRKALCGEVVESPTERITLPKLPGATFHEGRELCQTCWDLREGEDEAN